MGDSIEKNQKMNDLMKNTLMQLSTFDHETQNFFIKKLYNEMINHRESERKKLSEQSEAIQRANNSLGGMFREVAVK
jgi:hypothetical protein